jgi:hypothetical protein
MLLFEAGSAWEHKNWAWERLEGLEGSIALVPYIFRESRTRLGYRIGAFYINK